MHCYVLALLFSLSSCGMTGCRSSWNDAHAYQANTTVLCKLTREKGKQRLYHRILSSRSTALTAADNTLSAVPRPGETHEKRGEGSLDDTHTEAKRVRKPTTKTHSIVF